MNHRPTPGLPFVKMHGAGNDFVVIDARAPGAGRVSPALARAIGDRHRGVGFDQLAEILPDPDADYRLVFWNADGSEAGACGNASRCVAARMMEALGRDSLRFATRRGMLTAVREGGAVWVNMGAPQLDWDAVPLARAVDTARLPLDGDPAAVGMGNPHAVFFVPDAEAAPLTTLGPQVEHDPLFPQRTNVEFASLTGPDRLRMRVWERGTGVTLACGSGACATAVAAHRRGLTGRRVTLDLDGGTLGVDLRDDGVWLTGPVATVFEGTLTADWLAEATR
ncbi:diaminopimelate epimerase [Paracoccus sanguinis]|uniref:diaminopimelate epimerase n=1 Tax=Paracoccus sanguinis TaxID=1545044 RepID=UPI00051FCC1B|nr:diaminopimelate epimerase [Paracoccus sanguinis]KGJ19984.1 diaminopimelate epimerase [Paracoccus sanguinis]QJD16991.1 diaminopimelate epimerase [Paracoccus sanguinis]